MSKVTATALQEAYTDGYLRGQEIAYNRCDKIARELSDIKTGCSKWLDEHDAKIRAAAIDEIEEKLNNTGAEIIFNLPVEEILGEDIDLDDFAMLVQDAVQVYRKMVLGVLKQLKEQKNE